MNTPLPATEIAFRETLIHRIPGDDLDWLAHMYQLPRPALVSPESWRQALRAVLYGPRGTRGNMQAFLEAALAQWNVPYQVTTSLANPARITWASGGSAGGFTAKDVNRLWRVRGQLYRSVGPTFLVNPVENYLDLCPIRTGYWEAAAFTTAQQVSAELLPFVWADTHAQFFLWADVSAGAPPTYLQPAVMWGTKYLQGVAGSSYYPLGSDQPDQPEWKQDLSDSYSFEITEETAGTWRNLYVNADTGTVPARGGNYTFTVRKFSGGILSDTALTCTLGPALTEAADTVHTATLAVGDLVLLKVDAGVGVTGPLNWLRANVYIDPPAGMPKGGYILDTAWVSGNQTTGPWPLYIGTELDPELTAIVTKLLAAGVVPRPELADFAVLNGLL